MSDFSLDDVAFTDNPEPRCPCILLLDTSGSMGGNPIDELNAGLRELKTSLTDDPLAALRVEIAIITFGGSPVLAQDFVTASEFSPPQLSAGGGTPMGAAMQMALDQLEQRKLTYKAAGISYYRPWVFLITDGSPTDEWQRAAQNVQRAENAKQAMFFLVGVEGADMNQLGQMAPQQRLPIKLRGLAFRELFQWLSASLTQVSHSKAVGDQVALAAPTGWAQTT